MPGVTGFEPAGRTRARQAIVFAVPFLVVLAQGIYIGAGHREPYPALMMPGFPGTRTGPDGAIDIAVVEIAVHFGDGTTAPVEGRDLLAPLPGGAAMVLQERLLQCPMLAVPESTTWLKRRLAALHPGAPATSVGIRWYTDKYRVDDGVLRRAAHVPASACAVELAR